MPGFNPGALVTGHQAGRQQVAHQEASRRADEMQNMQLTTQNLQNQENQMIMNKVTDMETRYKEDYSAAMKTRGNETATKYYDSFKPDALTSGEFSADIGALQNYIDGIPSLAKMGNVRVPNTNDPDEMQKIKQLLDIGGDEEANYSSEDIAKEANMRALSGEVIINAQGDPVRVQDVFATIGAVPEMSAGKKFEAYSKAVNDIHLAKKGKYGQGTVDLYDQALSIKATMDKMKENGDPIPESLQEQYTKVQTAYLKAAAGDTAPSKFIATRKELQRARTNPAYPGEASDLEHYNTVQVKDKDKHFETGQQAFRSAETWNDLQGRVNKIFESTNLDRDAMANAGHKLAQYFEKEGTGADILGAVFGENKQEAQAAFDRIETTVGYEMALLIKDISGAAVSNEEREYLMNLVIGGEFKNMNTLTEKLDQFVNDKKDKAGKVINQDVTGVKHLRPKLAKQWTEKLKAFGSENIVGGTLSKKAPPVAEKKKTFGSKVVDTFNKVKSRITDATVDSAKAKANNMQVEVDDAPINDKQAAAIAELPDGQEVTIKGVTYTVKGGRLWK